MPIDVPIMKRVCLTAGTDADCNDDDDDDDDDFFLIFVDQN